MPKGFSSYISDEIANRKPFYSVLTNKGKDRRKNIIRSGTYTSKREAKTNALALAQKYNMNLRVFDLRKRRTN